MLMYSKLWHFLNIILYQDSGVNAYQVPNEKQMMEITKKAFSAQSNLFIIGKSNTLNKTRSSEFKMDSPISIEVISKEECCESIIGLKSATKEIKVKLEEMKEKRMVIVINTKDPSDEKFRSKWGHDKIKVLLDYIQENFSAWSKGNKTKFYNDMKYESIKKHNNQTGNERKDWYWYDKMDMIFGVCENITPSFLANKETGTIIEEKIVVIKEENKKQKQKSKNNVEVIAIAIAEISQT
ncbi:hypothetical protein GLOIN_2v1567919 [Rhizophagus clarus]|uniref:Uncharacterized protein n=1 Tax=Rhizophagus clarus TaxID=94130 RepID=A0A8H3LHF2_9GLOM|nr:hypothetical protein GLOIN_2v1567919 [Rhizophagus clarus]